MPSRRAFLFALPALLRGAALTPCERVDRVLKGRDVDRSPFTFWYHFGLEKEPGERHAEATLAFHRKFSTDLVKVMSDYPYPKPPGAWHELKEENNPFPEQIRALEMIRDGLAGRAHFIETIFNPWNVAEKLSAKEAVLRLKDERPQALLDALETIARSEANHARRAVAAGASGVFLAIANAEDGVLSRPDYLKFSEPFDKMVLRAVSRAPLNTMHLHGTKVYLDLFYKGWPANVFHYDAHGTGVAISEVRKSFAGVIMGGLDHNKLRSLSEDEIREEWRIASLAAGRKFILAPGCSAPNESEDEELMRIVRLVTQT
jgi:uroporphyrinogen-III decarboxylase